MCNHACKDRKLGVIVSSLLFSVDRLSLAIMDGSQGLLNTPQRYQQVSRQALREVIQNAEDSPRRRLPAPRPETPTPLPGYVERRRANVRSDHCGSRNGDPQSSPRRRRPNDARGENTAPFAAHTVCDMLILYMLHFDLFCDTDFNTAMYSSYAWLTSIVTTVYCTASTTITRAGDEGTVICTPTSSTHCCLCAFGSPSTST